MATVTHRCQFCDSDYPCDTFVQGEDEHGRERAACDCKATDECPGCSEHGACEECGKAPATGDGHKPFFCEPCEVEWIDNYSGPDEADYGGVSLSEQMDAAYTLDKRLR